MTRLPRLAAIVPAALASAAATLAIPAAAAVISVETDEVWAVNGSCLWSGECGEGDLEFFNMNQTLVIDTATSAVTIQPKPGGYGYVQARLYSEEIAIDYDGASDEDEWTRTPTPLRTDNFYVVLNPWSTPMPAYIDPGVFASLNWDTHTFLADLATAPTGTVLRYGGAVWQSWDRDIPDFSSPSYFELGPDGFVTVTVLEGAPVPVPLPAAGGVFAAALGLLGLWRRRPGRAASGA